MSDNDNGWKPSDEDSLKALIRSTMDALGPMDASAMPSKIKERLLGQVSGDLDVDAYIREVLADLKKKKDQ